MWHWGSDTAKRSTLWSNSLEVRRFDLGRLARSEMVKSKKKTSSRRRDKQGRLVWSGNHHLKGTQTLGFHHVMSKADSFKRYKFLKYAAQDLYLQVRSRHRSIQAASAGPRRQKRSAGCSSRAPNVPGFGLSSKKHSLGCKAFIIQ